MGQHDDGDRTNRRRRSRVDRRGDHHQPGAVDERIREPRFRRAPRSAMPVGSSALNQHHLFDPKGLAPEVQREIAHDPRSATRPRASPRGTDHLHPQRLAGVPRRPATDRGERPLLAMARLRGPGRTRGKRKRSGVRARPLASCRAAQASSASRARGCRRPGAAAAAAAPRGPSSPSGARRRAPHRRRRGSTRGTG